MTDLHDTIRAALEAATKGPWRSMRNGNQRIAEKDGRLQHVGASTVTGLPRAWNPAGIVADDPSVSRFTDADADLIASAPQWLAELLAECEALTVKRDRYLHALELVAPDGRGLQLFLGEGPAPGMPMYGSVCTESPYLIATKPEGPDASFAGAREVYQYTYDEDTQHEAEHCTVGYFVTEDWLCERDAGAEEKNREALARAEAAERERDEARSRAEQLAMVVTERPHNGHLMSIVAMRTRERDSARDLAVHRGEQIQRLQAEIAQHLAFRAEVNDALPRPFGVTVIGAIKALRAEVEARPAITEDDIDAIREGIYGDDRMSRKTLEAALAALSRVAHASQPKGDGKGFIR